MVVVGGATAYAMLRPGLGLARRASRAYVPLQPWSLPPEPPANPVELARALIGAAVLAPSGWNAQPWRFEVENSSIRLVADSQRALPANDPDRRGMMVSLGAALENLLVAARAWGLQPTVTYFPFEGAGGVVAEVTWTGGESRRDRGLFAAIPERRTNRREYDRRGLLPEHRAQLGAQVAEGPRLHWLDEPRALRELADLARDAVHAQVMDPRAQREQYAWTRFDDQAHRRGDGVPVDALELGGVTRWFAGRCLDPDSWFVRFGAASAAGQARDGIRSAGAAVLVTAPKRDEAQWLMAGQACERFALKATQLGLAHQPVNAPIEVERFRGDLLRRFGARGEEPLMLLRLGRAKRCPHTPRRAVALVASFRTT